MQTTGSMYSCSAVSKSGSPGFGWMQSTGQTSMHESSLMQLPVMTYVTQVRLPIPDRLPDTQQVAFAVPEPRGPLAESAMSSLRCSGLRGMRNGNRQDRRRWLALYVLRAGVL